MKDDMKEFRLVFRCRLQIATNMVFLAHRDGIPINLQIHVFELIKNKSKR